MIANILFNVMRMDMSAIQIIVVSDGEAYLLKLQNYHLKVLLVQKLERQLPKNELPYQRNNCLRISKR